MENAAAAKFAGTARVRRQQATTASSHEDFGAEYHERAPRYGGKSGDNEVTCALPPITTTEQQGWTSEMSRGQWF